MMTRFAAWLARGLFPVEYRIVPTAKIAVVSALAQASAVNVNVVVLREACIKEGTGKLDMPAPLQATRQRGFA